MSAAYLTLKEVLRLSVSQPVTWLSGTESQARRVRWVATQPDEAGPDDILLLPASRLSAKLVRQAAAQGAAALLLVGDPPPLPAALPGELAILSIPEAAGDARQVQRMILTVLVNQRAALIERGVRIHAQLSQMEAEGKGLAGLAKAMQEISGRGNVLDKSRQLELDLSSEQARDVLAQIKALEAQGFTFESAEGSVSILLRRLQPDYQPLFELIDFVVVVEHRQGRGILAEATVKVRVGEQMVHTAAEGNGPVSALDAALRKALLDVYPALAHVRLDDYKVRILDSDNGTGAAVRVLIDTKNGTRRWSTVGASTNIIEASWRAMADSLEFALFNGYDAKPAPER